MKYKKSHGMHDISKRGKTLDTGIFEFLVFLEHPNQNYDS